MIMKTLAIVITALIGLICISITRTPAAPAIADSLLTHAVLTPRDARPWMRLADRRFGQPSWIAGGRHAVR